MTEKIKAVASLSEVRKRLATIESEVANDADTIPQAKERVNALGKLIKTCSEHLLYCDMAKKTPTGEWASFLEN